MTGVPIEFPLSTAPGVNSAESGGRLINAYVEKAPDGSRSKFLWRRAPGLVEEFAAGSGEWRGAIVVGSTLYVANGDEVYPVTEAGGVFSVGAALTGTLDGEGPVLFASNMATTPHILAVHSLGMAEIASGAVSSFSDADLPATNSISFLDGYFLFGVEAGQVFNSGLNAKTVASTDKATAEASSDPLYRVVVYGREALFMGRDTIEFWANAGNPSGSPLDRGAVIQVGLLGRYAVAGFEPGFGGALCFVANDRTVRQLSGYAPERISTPDIERLLNAVEDPDTLEASVYVASGHSCWVLSSPDWTWVYDQTTGQWHERQSYQQALWRAHFGINAFGKWLVFDRGSNKVFSVDPTAKTEDGDPLIFENRSTQVHRFPQRMIVDRAAFDMLVGVGINGGAVPIETDPKVSISWSDDGGQTFGNALLRRLGAQGEQTTVEVNRCGQSGRKGRQWKLQVSDPVEVVLFGGAMFPRATG